MNEYEKLVPVETRELIETLVKQARENLEKDGDIMPVAFVGRHDGEFEIIALAGDFTEAQVARLLGKQAREANADFVLRINEAWAIRASSAQEGKKLVEQYGEVKKMPGRVDVVMVRLETYTGLFVSHVDRIENEGTPKYTFGAVELKLIERDNFPRVLPKRGATR